MIFIFTTFMFIFALLGISYTILGKRFFFNSPNAYNLRILCELGVPLVPLNRLVTKRWNKKLFKLCFFHLRLLWFFKIVIIMHLLVLTISAIFLPSKISEQAIRIVDLFITSPNTPSPPILLVLFLALVIIYILVLIFSWVYIDFIESETKKISDEIEKFAPE